jgi:hypothetical protein
LYRGVSVCFCSCTEEEAMGAEAFHVHCLAVKWYIRPYLQLHSKILNLDGFNLRVEVYSVHTVMVWHHSLFQCCRHATDQGSRVSTVCMLLHYKASKQCCWR